MGDILKRFLPSLHDEVISGNIGRVMEILDRDPALVHAKTADKKTPLHLAASTGHRGIASVLLSAGADVNCRDAQGYTPLHGASMRGHSEIVSLLIDSGANVNAVARDEVTPLKLAIKHGHMKIELTLKRYGARR